MLRSFTLHARNRRLQLTVLCLLGTVSLFTDCAFRKGVGPTTRINIDGNGAGRVFDGIGAVSAGASTRLLVDYPEPVRNQILDYLFKPYYGASLQELKVEIGGDVNSTDGAEPSHMRSAKDVNFNRGYEWWLMEEAKNRNPDIILDSLAWGAPGWIGNGNLYSQDMADYVVKFIQGARSAHHLELQYTGVWNEKEYQASYVKQLKKTLVKNGLSTRIVCCDLAWAKVADEVAADPEFREAVSVIGVHAPNVLEKATAPEAARASGKPLWASEDEFFYYTQGLPKTWSPFAESLAMIYNLNYIRDRITSTEIWSPVTSYYDNLPAPGSGLMRANTPWSGHYEVPPTVWVTAHTTQFARPGWRYLDSGCGYLAGQGSYVTLKSPTSGDYSTIVETIEAKAPQKVVFATTGNLSPGIVHVWESNATRNFEHVTDLTPQNGSFSITLDADSLYSFTTTSGQGKGTATPAPSAPFPFPFTENFDEASLGASPPYFADQDGAFEVRPCLARGGRCLEQVINQKPISWGLLPDPYTLLGSADWGDYTVSTDAQLEQAGEVRLLGRIDDADYFKDEKARFPAAYVLEVDQEGRWNLLSTKLKASAVKLASGQARFPLKIWHHLELNFKGTNIQASLDGKIVANVQDTTHRAGMVGVGCGWNRTEFDNFAVK